jgi:hypothetical protein
MVLKVQQLHLIVDTEIMLIKIEFVKLTVLSLTLLVVVTVLIHVLHVLLVSMYQHALLQARLVVIIQEILVAPVNGV